MTHNITVARAAKAHLDEIAKLYITNPAAQDTLKERICYSACDISGKMLGYIIYSPKQNPVTGGVDFWMHWLRVLNTENRRQGIGTALLNTVKQDAVEQGAVHLLGSTDTTPAHRFWEHHGALFTRYGKQIDHPSDPERHGNYNHFFVIRVNESSADIPCREPALMIQPSTSQQLDRYFTEELMVKNPGYFQEKRNALFGFTSYDANHCECGHIVFGSDSRYQPLEGEVYNIYNIRIQPDLVRLGIGSALLRAVEDYAESHDIHYLRAAGDEQLWEFWYKNGYAVLPWKYVGQTNTILTAMKKI